jgi:F-type H+-transporting ATPase subunit b
VNINLTLIVQTLMFVVLIWFTMKFVWPMILGPMDERARKIAAGLAAAEKGTQELASANERAEAIMREARERAGQIIDQAQHRANDLVEDAKGTATA